MSVHDYFKPCAPKHSKKQIWQIPVSGKIIPIFLPKILQEKTYDLKSLVPVISFPIHMVNNIDKAGNQKNFKARTRLFRNSTKTSYQETLEDSRQKSLEKLKISFLNPETAKNNRKVEFRPRDSIRKSVKQTEKPKLSIIKISSSKILNSEPIQNKSLNKITTKKQNTQRKECASLPSLLFEEFELKGW